MAILGIYRGWDAEALLKRRYELLTALTKTNGRSGRSWNDGGVSVSENYDFSALRDELAEVLYEIRRRGLDSADSDSSGGNAFGGFVPAGVRLF